MISVMHDVWGRVSLRLCWTDLQEPLTYCRHDLVVQVGSKPRKSHHAAEHKVYGAEAKGGVQSEFDWSFELHTPEDQKRESVDSIADELVFRWVSHAFGS